MTNLSRHPVLRAIYGASQAIEKCGASRELTDAVMAVTALYAPAEGLLDRIASLERQLEDTKRENDTLRGLLGNTATGAKVEVVISRPGSLTERAGEAA